MKTIKNSRLTGLVKIISCYLQFHTVIQRGGRRRRIGTKNFLFTNSFKCGTFKFN